MCTWPVTWAVFAAVKRRCSPAESLPLSILLQRASSMPNWPSNGATVLGKLKAIVRFRAGVERYTARGVGQVELPQADTVICRCEHVDPRADRPGAGAGRAGHRQPEDAHPGEHGRLSGADVRRLLQRSPAPATGRQDVGWLRPRFPMDPIPFSAFQSSARRPEHEPSSTTSSLPAAA
jgi:hypothetical protein